MAHFDEFRKIGILRNQVFRSVPFRRLVDTEENNGEGAVELAFHDVAVDNLANPTEIQVRLKRSKTDVSRQGTLIHIGRTDDDLCPVAALLSWMVTRGNRPGPLFYFASGKPLSRSTFVREFRQAVSEAGVSPNGYSGHSFRSSLAGQTAFFTLGRGKKGSGDTPLANLFCSSKLFWNSN